MGEQVTLTAADGHELGAYLARPDGEARAGLVVCQEIFGVNGHIRAVVHGFAAEGYLTVAPALFDRVERGVELAYDEAGFTRGRGLRSGLSVETVMLDVAAAVVAAGAAAADYAGPEAEVEVGVGVVGYCWGGSLAWLAACRLEVAAAVGYYGGQIHEHRNETRRCPVLLHFGGVDAATPEEQVAEIRALHPEVEIRTYPDAGHGFNCDLRADYHAEAAALARRRSLAFLARHLG